MEPPRGPLKQGKLGRQGSAFLGLTIHPLFPVGLDLGQPGQPWVDMGTERLTSNPETRINNGQGQARKTGTAGQGETMQPFQGVSAKPVIIKPLGHKWYMRHTFHENVAMFKKGQGDLGAGQSVVHINERLGQWILDPRGDMVAMFQH